MEVRDHIIHSRSGKLLGDGDVTSIADAKRIARTAWQKAGASGIVLHFHGGLVNQAAAMAGAQRLFKHCYEPAGAYPIFAVWESGFLETIRNNLGEIARDPVFQKLVAKVAEWVMREAPGAAPGTKGAGAAVDSAGLEREFQDWFAGRTAEPPVKDHTVPGAAATKGVEPDEDDLSLKIRNQIEQDQDLQELVAGLAVKSGRIAEHRVRSSGFPPRDVPVLVDEMALDEMFGPPTNVQTKGMFGWAAVAKFVAKVVIAVIRRYLAKRDHGGYTTIVEEVLRAAYLDQVGKVIWGKMKKDTADAFSVADGAGELVLQEWAKLAAQGGTSPKVTLVGHSTGAVYINHWIRRSAQLFPNQQYNVVLLAPACLVSDFAAVIASHGGLVKDLRIFAMQDLNEAKDVLVPIVYLRSLLYFVSGVVEPEVDAPVLGMERFLVNSQYAELTGIKDVTRYIGEGAHRAIWSIADGNAGLSTHAVHHGDFDDDKITLGSVISILKNGY